MNVIINKFLNKKSGKLKNDSTDGISLFFHGNKIAWWDVQQIKYGNPPIEVLYISTCGWNTRSTKDRLNELPGVSVYQKKGILFLNTKPWDGKPIIV